MPRAKFELVTSRFGHVLEISWWPKRSTAVLVCRNRPKRKRPVQYVLMVAHNYGVIHPIGQEREFWVFRRKSDAVACAKEILPKMYWLTAETGKPIVEFDLNSDLRKHGASPEELNA